MAREIRALSEARAVHPHAKAQLILMDPLPVLRDIPADIEITPAIEWFLETPEK